MEQDEVVDDVEVREERVVAPGAGPVPGPHEREQAVVRETETVTQLEDGSIATERVRTEDRRRAGGERLGLLLGLLALLALAALGGWWLLTREDTKQVPAVVGLASADAVQRVESDGFDAQTSTQPDDAPAGQVVEQQPTAGTDADKGSTVTLLVSGGPATVAVPNAVGVTEAEARDRLVQAGFQVRSREVFSDETPGTVVAQSPAAGSDADADAEVTINVSKGSGLVDVPSVVGLSRADAEAQLSDAGLEANVVDVPSDDPAGTVVAQNPVGGTLRKGSAVRLNVSTGR